MKRFALEPHPTVGAVLSINDPDRWLAAENHRCDVHELAVGPRPTCLPGGSLLQHTTQEVPPTFSRRPQVVHGGFSVFCLQPVEELFEAPLAGLAQLENGECLNSAEAVVAKVKLREGLDAYVGGETAAAKSVFACFPLMSGIFAARSDFLRRCIEGKTDTGNSPDQLKPPSK